MDPFDELAALFLTEPDAPGHGGCVAGQGLTTELVVIGHLPVRAGLWLTPYVDAMARQGGPAALLRLDGGGATVELLRGSEASLPIQPPADFHAAVGSIAGQIGMCMIRGREPINAGELVRSGADRITVLSSADEAAVVAAYGIVKDLVESAEQTAATLPRLGLAVIGSSEQQATRMIDRLNRTTATFLGVRIPLVACLSRMDAAVRTTRFWQFADVGEVRAADLVAFIREAHAAAAAEAKVTTHAAPVTQPIREAPVVLTESFTTAPPPRRDPPVIHVEIPRRRDASEPAVPAHQRERSSEWAGESSRLESVEGTQVPRAGVGASFREGRIQVHPEAINKQRGADGEPPPPRPPATTTQAPEAFDDVARFAAFGSAASPGIRAIKMPPKPARHVETKRGEAAIEPDDHGRPVDLASYVGGLKGLDRIRCPGHERVELALDAHGGMHLLAREASMRDLWAVESWFRAHAELIAMACPQHALDIGRKVQMHLFTDQPVSVADLHDSALRLYVLAPVRVGEQTAWYCAPLK